MNALTCRANRRERMHNLIAALRCNAGAVCFLAAVVALMCAVGGMEYTDAVRLEGMR